MTIAERNARTLNLPSQERAQRLRAVYSEYVEHPSEIGWKAGAEATVPNAIADTVAEAMNFIGSKVDERRPASPSRTYLRSKGYYHHIGA